MIFFLSKISWNSNNEILEGIMREEYCQIMEE